MNAFSPGSHHRLSDLLDRGTMRTWPVAVALGLDLAVVLLHLANQMPGSPFGPPHRFFDLSLEANLPTWWASIQLWTASMLLARAAASHRHLDRLALWLGSALLGALSLDETTGLHERVASVTRTDLFPVTGLWPFLLAPALLVAASAIAYVGRTVWRLDATSAALLAAGLMLLVVSAAGVELFVNVVTPGTPDQAMQVLVEESGELVAGTLLLAGSLRFAARRPAHAHGPG